MGFAHVVLAAPGRTVHVAGQTAHGSDGAVQGETMLAQVDAALGNLVMALQHASVHPSCLVSMQIYVTDVQAYREVTAQLGAVWRRHLGKHYPAVSLLGVTALYDPDAMVEIVAVAVQP